MTVEKRSESISVFFPAYNDARSIGALVEAALSILPRLTDDYEVIVVNDGSGDDTASVLRELMLSNPFMRVIEHETNRGYGGALQSGFRACSKDLIFYTDGDGQYDVLDIEKLHSLLGDDVDIVNGYKINRADGASRKLIGGFYNRLAHVLFTIPIRDVDCDFRLIRRRAMEGIELSSNSGCICVELIYKLQRTGMRFREIGVSHYERVHGRSQFLTVSRVSKTLQELLSLRLNLAFVKSSDRKNFSKTARPRKTR